MDHSQYPTDGINGNLTVPSSPYSSAVEQNPVPIEPPTSWNLDALKTPMQDREASPSHTHSKLAIHNTYPYDRRHVSSIMIFQRGEMPIDVVSPGHRLIRPNAPDRSTPIGAFAKNADGKFPCPHCTKTYLHVKHLKRHLLRHSGDRPYACVVCQDTFSRSDVMKRHFQKCSVRPRKRTQSITLPGPGDTSTYAFQA